MWSKGTSISSPPSFGLPLEWPRTTTVSPSSKTSSGVASKLSQCSPISPSIFITSSLPSCEPPPGRSSELEPSHLMSSVQVSITPSESPLLNASKPCLIVSVFSAIPLLSYPSTRSIPGAGPAHATTLAPVRTVYVGTSEFAVTVLAHLAGTEHRPELVVTRPDRPRGRGRRLAPPPVADTAAELGIAVLQPENVNSDECTDAIAATGAGAVCICAYGGLIKEPLLSYELLLNVHPSLLPRWRGAAPVERAIEAGDRETGISIMRPTEELDAGPVCLQRRQPITAEDDYGSLAERAAELAA